MITKFNKKECKDEEIKRKILSGRFGWRRLDWLFVESENLYWSAGKHLGQKENGFLGCAYGREVAGVGLQFI